MALPDQPNLAGPWFAEALALALDTADLASPGQGRAAATVVDPPSERPLQPAAWRALIDQLVFGAGLGWPLNSVMEALEV